MKLFMLILSATAVIGNVLSAFQKFNQGDTSYGFDKIALALFCLGLFIKWLKED
jgi:hypothetical protein